MLFATGLTSHVNFTTSKNNLAKILIECHSIMSNYMSYMNKG